MSEKAYMIEFAYNPDQPRDADGKFGSGGGSSKGDSKGDSKGGDNKGRDKKYKQQRIKGLSHKLKNLVVKQEALWEDLRDSTEIDNQIIETGKEISRLADELHRGK